MDLDDLVDTILRFWVLMIAIAVALAPLVGLGFLIWWLAS